MEMVCILVVSYSAEFLNFIDVYLHLSFSMWCVHRRLLSGENGVKVRGRELR